MPKRECVVVVSQVGSGLAPRVYKGPCVKSALMKARKHEVIELEAWTPAMDEYLEDKWRRMQTRNIAEALSIMTGRKITRNAVIGRAYRMGLPRHAMASTNVHARLEGVHQNTNASGAMHRVSEAADN